MEYRAAAKRLMAKLRSVWPNKGDADVPLKPYEIAIAAVFCAVLVAGAVGGAVWYARSRQNTQPATRAADARGFTLTPPDGWQKVTPTPEGTSVAFSRPSNDGSGTSRVFIAVQSSKLNSQSASSSFEDISRTYVEQLSHGYEGFALLSTRSVTLNDTPATLVTFSYVTSLAKQTVQSLFAVKAGMSYAANGEAPTDQWQEYAASIEESLLTFRP